MDKQTAIKFERLKKDYLDMERVTHDEKECLLKIINTFGIVMAMHTELAEEYDEVKKLVNYKKGGSIGLLDVNLLVKPKIETDIFKTIEAKPNNVGVIIPMAKNAIACSQHTFM